jgi:predicted metal-binding protein
MNLRSEAAMEPFRFHVFVCTQQKPEGVPSCPAHGSFAVLERLDREIQARGLGIDVQITTCGCMGLCDEGPVIVVYPEGVWYRRVGVCNRLIYPKSSQSICSMASPSTGSSGVMPLR